MSSTTARIGMIHQPHFLPWPGYIARCLAVDVFVVLDNVKFNRNHYQHRTKFIDSHGNHQWLTLPINHKTRSSTFSNVLTAESLKPNKWQRSFVSAGSRLPFFASIWPDVYSIIVNSKPSLLDINMATLCHTLGLLTLGADSCSPEIIMASTMSCSSDRTHRLSELCEQVGLTHLVMGSYAVESHNVEYLAQSGLELLTHRYIGPTRNKPETGVTSLCDIFRFGCAEVSETYRSDWVLEPIQLPT